MRDIIERARFRGERFLVHTFGKPMAVIIGIEEYSALVQSVQNGPLNTDESRTLPLPESPHPTIESVP